MVTIRIPVTRALGLGLFLGTVTALVLLLGAFVAAAGPAPAPQAVPGISVCSNCRVIAVSPDADAANYTTVQEALSAAAALTPTASSPVLVYVAPGTYDLGASGVQVPAYVHLQGAGRDVTIITSTNSNSVANDDAATVDLANYARISDLTVRNSGASQISVALYSAVSGRDTVIDNVIAEADGDGGSGHYALYLNDAEVHVLDSLLRAKGATTVNAGVGIINASGGFPRPLIEGSALIGGTNSADDYPSQGAGLPCSGNSSTGFGYQGGESAAIIIDSYLCGDQHALSNADNGLVQVRWSQLWGGIAAGNELLESTGSASLVITHSQVLYVTHKYTGNGNLTCTHNTLGNGQAASNGTTSGTSCN